MNTAHYIAQTVTLISSPLMAARAFHFRPANANNQGCIASNLFAFLDDVLASPDDKLCLILHVVFLTVYRKRYALFR